MPWGGVCNFDGTLKDAEDIDFSEPGTQATALANSSHSTRQFQFVSVNPGAGVNTQASAGTYSHGSRNKTKRTLPLDAVVPPSTKKCAGAVLSPNGAQKGKVVLKAGKKKPIDHVLDVEVNVSEPAPKVVQKRAKDATHDVLTVFTKVDPDDDGEGHRCEIC